MQQSTTVNGNAGAMNGPTSDLRLSVSLLYVAGTVVPVLGAEHFRFTLVFNVHTFLDSNSSEIINLIYFTIYKMNIMKRSLTHSRMIIDDGFSVAKPDI